MATDTVREAMQWTSIFAKDIAGALRDLGVDITREAANELGEIVALTMNGQHRVYHQAAHVLDVVPQDSEDKDPLARLAAVFHDVVHLRVDNEVPSAVLPILHRAGIVPLPSSENMPDLRWTERAQRKLKSASRVDQTLLATRCASGRLPRLRACGGHLKQRRLGALCRPAAFALAAGVRKRDLIARSEGVKSFSRSNSSSSSSSSNSDEADCSGADTNNRPEADQSCHDTSDGKTNPAQPEDEGVAGALSCLSNEHVATVDNTRLGMIREVRSWWDLRGIGLRGSHLSNTNQSKHKQRGQRILAQRLCYRVFGFRPGHVLEFSTRAQGLSEFLSCVVAMDLLSPWLDELQLLHVCACIEATVPFRRASCLDTLWSRCREAIDEELPHLGLSSVRAAGCTQDMVESACQMAGRDLSNFASRDTRDFLINTWALLPEFNAELRAPHSFTLRSWIRAVSANLHFFESLANDPTRVFPCFGGSHTQLTHLRLLLQTSTNLDRGRVYFAARLVTASIMHALLAVGGLNPDTTPLIGFMKHGMGGCVPTNVRGLPVSDGPRIDFGDRSVETNAYAEELLRCGFAHEDMTCVGTDMSDCLFSSACEASLFVFRHIAMPECPEQQCLEQCQEAALAYSQDRISVLAFLSKMPFACTKFVANNVVRYALDHIQRQTLDDWVYQLWPHTRGPDERASEPALSVCVHAPALDEVSSQVDVEFVSRGEGDDHGLMQKDRRVSLSVEPLTQPASSA